MESSPLPLRRTAVARGAALLAALYLTGGLLWLLPSPGYGPSRLALFAVVLAVGWVGAAGVYRRRTSLIVTGAGGLLLLGFWQAVLWIILLPTGVAYVLAGALVPDSTGE